MHTLIPPAVPAANITLEAREPHMEVINLQTRDVWLCQQPISGADFKALKLAAPLIKAGHGRATFDFAWFERSPGAQTDGTLETTQLGGLPFSRVARLDQLRGMAAGEAPTRMLIEKHHGIGFDAGSSVCFARLPDGGLYIQQTASSTEVAETDPPDWTLFRHTLTDAWVLNLPCPSVVYFFRSLRSFAGPLDVAWLPPGFAAGTPC